MDLVNRAFAEVMMEGDAKGRVFTFPIPTYNLTADFDWENPNLEPLWRMTGKYGIPYFSNFINSDMSPEDARSMCCRLRLDNRELLKRGGGLFGANPLKSALVETLGARAPRVLDAGIWTAVAVSLVPTLILVSIALYRYSVRQVYVGARRLPAMTQGRSRRRGRWTRRSRPPEALEDLRALPSEEYLSASAFSELPECCSLFGCKCEL